MLFASLCLTAAVGAVVAGIERRYLASHPCFYDAAFYSLENARLHEWAREDGRLAVLRSELRSNGRYPLRTVPLLLLAPGLLADPLGHLVTALPALAVFLSVLGWHLLGRSGSLSEALLGMTAFAALPMMFHPRYGLGAYWLDLPAAMLLGAALLCLLNADGRREGFWLVLAGVLGAAAVLSRFVAAAFVLNSCGPVLAWQLAVRWRRERSFRALGCRLALVGGAFLALAGPYLVAHAAANARWYAALGYALWGPVATALRSVATRVAGSFSVPVLAICAGLAAVNVSALPPRGRAGLVPGIWAALSHPLLLALVLRNVGHPQSHLYAIPPLFVLAAAPGSRGGRFAGVARRLSCAGLAAVVCLGVLSAVAQLGESDAPGEEKLFENRMASALAKAASGPVVWGTFFDQRTHITSLEVFYGFRLLPLPDGLFTPHEGHWRSAYPGMLPAQVARAVYERACRWDDVVAVFAVPRSADSRFDNPYSREVARFVAESVRADPRWEKVGSLKATPFDRLAIYRNRQPSRAAYGRLLRGLLPE